MRLPSLHSLAALLAAFLLGACGSTGRPYAFAGTANLNSTAEVRGTVAGLDDRGDRIAAQVDLSDYRVRAQEIEMVHDSAGLGGAGAPVAMRGFVRRVDAHAQTLAVRPATGGAFHRRLGSVVIVHYDALTVAHCRGGRCHPGELGPGDEILIELLDVDDALLAKEIVVLAGLRATALD
jgi:hypothetical protein